MTFFRYRIPGSTEYAGRVPWWPVVFLFLSMAKAAVIQPNMYLSIMVKGDEFLTQQVQVKEDGTIDYPLYQDIAVNGLTTSELQDILTLKLANYSDAPFVVVTVLSALPLNVQVLGQVKNPGPIEVASNASLQEVLSLAGGPTDFADLSVIKIVHAGQEDEDAHFYDFQKFLSTGNISLLPQIQEGDRIIVLTSSKINKVKVLGAVNKPGYFSPNDSTSVFDIIYLAGGPTADANLSRVRILGNENERETDHTVNMQDYIDKGELSEMPMVKPGDVVILYRKSFTWSKTLTAVRDIVTLVTAWFVISQLFK